MKKLFGLLVCALLVGAIALSTACVGTPKSIAYKTLKSTEDTVDAAMRGYADAVVAGAVEQKVQDQVRIQYGRYQVAFEQAVQAAKLDLQTATPAEVAGLAAELTALIASYVH